MDAKQTYVIDCKQEPDRLAITFQFPALGLRFTWWQRKQDFETGDDWENEAADDYEACSRWLAGSLLAVGFPVIANGALQIGINPKDKTAQICVVHYNSQTETSDVIEAEYMFTLPSMQLADAFHEAALAIRKTKTTPA